MIELTSNTTAFRSEKTFEGIGKVWGTKLTLPAAHRGTKAKAGAWRELQDGGVDLAGVLISTPVSKWGATLDDLAAQEVKAGLIRDHHETVARALNDRAGAILRSGATYDHVLDQLPVEETEQKFTQAVLTLGDRVHNMGEAVDFDAVAVQDFRDAGRKLLALQGLNLNGAYSVRHFTSSLFAEPVKEVPDLHIRNGEHQFTTGQLEDNYKVAGGRLGVKDQGEYITALVLGRKPGLKLSVATTWEELLERSQVFGSAGSITNLDKTVTRPQTNPAMYTS